VDTSAVSLPEASDLKTDVCGFGRAQFGIAIAFHLFFAYDKL